jgi:hypothetical protein
MFARIAVLSLAATAALCGPAAAMECPKPLNQTEAQYTGQAKLDLAKLGPVTGGRLDVKLSKTSTNLYAAYPNADRVAVSNAILSAACQLIAESKLSDEKKFDLFLKATDQVRRIMK